MPDESDLLLNKLACLDVRYHALQDRDRAIQRLECTRIPAQVHRTFRYGFVNAERHGLICTRSFEDLLECSQSSRHVADKPVKAAQREMNSALQAWIADLFRDCS